MRFKKKKYINIVTGDEKPRTGLCQKTKYFYRKVIKYASAPLHKFADEITEEKYHEIIDAFGECIYQKIIDGGIYEFPCERFGRLYIRKFDRNERKENGKFRFPKLAMNGHDMHTIWWNGKSFKNRMFTYVLLKNTFENVSKYINDTYSSNANYYTKIENIKK